MRTTNIARYCATAPQFWMAILFWIIQVGFHFSMYPAFLFIRPPSPLHHTPNQSVFNVSAGSLPGSADTSLSQRRTPKKLVSLNDTISDHGSLQVGYRFRFLSAFPYVTTPCPFLCTILRTFYFQANVNEIESVIKV